MVSGWCGGISTMGLVHMWPCREIVMGTSGNDFLDKTLYSEIKKCPGTQKVWAWNNQVQPNTENFLKTAVKVPLLKWVVLAWLGYKTSCLAWSDDRITLGSFLAGYLDIISDTGNFRVISLVLCWADRRRPPGKSRAAAWRSSTWWP